MTNTARYDAVAGFYAASDDEAEGPVSACLFELAGPLAGKRVLEIACGHGPISRASARRGARVVGVDICGSARPAAG